MKKLSLMAILLLSLNVMANSTLFVPVEDAYIPSGFDSNDHVEIVVTGYLPNLCYHSPKATVTKTEGTSIYIEVKSYYKYELGDVCPEVIVPFTETVSVGVLKKGDYKIIVNQNQPTTVTDKLTIEDNNSPFQDENIYLYVDYVKKDFANKTIEIVGLNPSDCFKFEEVKFISNGKNTVSVLPILKKATDFCPMKMTPMTIEVKMPDELPAQKVLLHVRSMEGKSYNTLYMNVE